MYQDNVDQHVLNLKESTTCTMHDEDKIRMVHVHRFTVICDLITSLLHALHELYLLCVRIKILVLVIVTGTGSIQIIQRKG